MTLNLTTAGRLTECLLLSYRTPADRVRGLVPGGLEPVTRGGYAFWNVVACAVQGMRPVWMPQALGVDYRHVAYRLHVTARTATGDGTLRGLYFVRSDADNGLLSCLGNALTDFRFHRSDVEMSRRDHVLTVAVIGRGAEPDPRDGEPAGDVADAIARVALDDDSATLQPPPGSPFADADDADRVLRYAPLGMAVDVDGRYLKLAEVIRDEAKWSERPVKVIESHFRFFDALGFDADEVRLERATRVAPIDYRWRLGRRVALQGPAPAPSSQPAAAGSPARAAA